MVLKEIEVTKPEGMNSKSCALLVQRAMRFQSDVMMECGAQKVNCKSVMGVISLGLKCGDKVILITRGEDEEDAAADVSEMF